MSFMSECNHDCASCSQGDCTSRKIEKLNTIYWKIRKLKLCTLNDRILVALSGGKDSITLLHALKTLQFLKNKNLLPNIVK